MSPSSEQPRVEVNKTMAGSAVTLFGCQSFSGKLLDNRQQISALSAHLGTITIILLIHSKPECN
jgi:hypothetical protein